MRASKFLRIVILPFYVFTQVQGINNYQHQYQRHEQEEGEVEKCLSTFKFLNSYKMTSEKNVITNCDKCSIHIFLSTSFSLSLARGHECRDSQEPFLWINNKTRTCEFIKSQIKWACRKPEAQLNCPKTCDSCSSDLCPNTGAEWRSFQSRCGPAPSRFDDSPVPTISPSNNEDWSKPKFFIGANEMHYSGTSSSLSSDGNTIVIGEPGRDRARVVRRRVAGAVWLKLGTPLLGRWKSQFGHSTAISNDGLVIAVGGWSYDFGPGGIRGSNFGFVRTYTFVDNAWMQLGNDLIGTSSDDAFGHSLSMNGIGNRIAIGAPSTNMGYVRVFDLSFFKWEQVGLDIIGKEGDRFGNDVSITEAGDIIAIGTSGIVVTDGGKYVNTYELINGNTWTLHGSVSGSDISFGQAVSLSGDGSVMAVGSPYEGDADEGAIYIYKRMDRKWILSDGQPILGVEEDSRIGFSVAVSGDGSTIAIGSKSTKINTRVVIWDGTEFLQHGRELFDGYGASVSLSFYGSTIVIGTGFDSSKYLYAGKTTVYDWEELKK